MFILPRENILKEIRVISFDIDNTLTFMEEAVDRANRIMFEYAMQKYPKLQLQSPNEIGDQIMQYIVNNAGYCKNIGELRRSIIQNYVEKAGYDLSVRDELFQIWRNERRKTTLIPYAKELLTLLHKHGFTLALLTNGTSTMEYHTEVNKFFKTLMNPDTCEASKPSVVPYEKLMDICGIQNPSACMHVGDDYMTDVTGAIRAGWKSVFITNRLPYSLSNGSPTVLVPSMKELYEYFYQLLEQLIVCFEMIDD